MDTKYKIHAFYIFFILLSIIVILVSVKWGDIPTLVQYFSFALTLSSLLLALLAIIYSFYSSSSSAQNISTLSALSNSISQSAIQLHNSSQDIAQQMTQLPSHLKVVQGKVEETQTLIKELYAPPPSKKDPDVTEQLNPIIERFLPNTSFVGLEFLYALNLLSKGEKEFDFNLKDLSEKTSIGYLEYMHGYAVCCSSIGLVSGKFNVNDKSHITVLHPEIVKKIKDAIYKRASDQKDTLKTNWLAKIAAIDTYVSSLSSSAS